MTNITTGPVTPIISEYAELAQAVYEPSKQQIGDWTRLSNSELSDAGIDLKNIQNDKIGYKAAIYQNSVGDKVVAFAGTETSSVKEAYLDIKTDIKQAVGLKDKQYDAAVNLARQTNKAFPNNKIMFTGHSLGGGLATQASAVTGKPATTFNPAGINNRTLKREGVNPVVFRDVANNGQVTRYVVKGEALDAVQRRTPAPTAPGKLVTLIHPDPPNMLKRHMMTSVIEALGSKLIEGISAPGGKGGKGVGGCIGKIVAGAALEFGMAYGAQAIVRLAQVGVIEANKKPPPPPPAKNAATKGHQIKHASLLAALAGAAVGALVAFTVYTAAAAIGVAAGLATGGIGAVVVGIAAVAIAGPLIGKVTSATTNFIDSLMPADDGPIVTIPKPSNVFVEGEQSARATFDGVTCVKHTTPPIQLIAQGSDSVFINTFNAVRIDDKTTCGAPIKEGAKTVFIGGNTTTLKDIANEFSWWERALIIGVEFLVPPTRGAIKMIANAPKMLASKLPGVVRNAVKGARTAFASKFGGLSGRAFKNALIKGKSSLKNALAGLCNLKGKGGSKRSNSKNSKNNKSTKPCKAGNPVDPIKGDVIKDYTDFTLGQSIPLQFNRTYRSSIKTAGLLGQGWLDSFSEHLIIDNDQQQITLHANEGLIVTFDVPTNTKEVFNRRYPHLLLSIYPQGYVIKNTDSDLFHYYRYTKDQKACLITIVDRNRNQIQFVQNELGNPIEVHHSDGIKLTLEYEYGLLRKINRVDTDEETLIAEYKQNGSLLVSAWSQGNHDHKFSYNDAKLMCGIHYCKDSEVLYEYDKSERCITMRGSDGFSYWDFDYNEKKQANAARDANHNTWIFHYNDEQQVIKEIAPNGAETLSEYDRYGLLLSETDATGSKHSYTYDAWSGKLLQTEDSLGRITKINYDEDLENIESIKSNDGITRFAYKDDKLSQVFYPDDTHLSYQYDRSGNVTQVKTNTSNTQSYSYNNKNHLVTASDWLHHEQQYQFNQHDQLSKIITPRNNEWEYDYDHDNRLNQIKSPLNTSERIYYNNDNNPHVFADANDNKQQIKYGIFSLPIEQTDAEGNVTRFEYDKIHQYISKITNALGQNWLFEYDAVGSLIKETDYNGHSTTYTYTSLGQVASKKTPMGETIRYIYDVAGRLIQKHTKEGASLYEWDEQDRLIKLKTPNTTSSYQYNKKGQLTQESQNEQIIRYEYDERGNRKARHIDASPWTNKDETQSTHYQYDANGQLVQLTLPDQKPLQLQYDADGNLTHQQTEAGYINHQLIDKKGRVEQQNIGKDQRAEYKDSFTKHEHLPQMAFAKRSYDYDAADNLLQCKSLGGDVQWSYNNNNQITHHKTQRTTEHYQYNSQLGVQSFNSTDNTQADKNNHYSASGQLLETEQSKNNGLQYQYDANGRLTSKVSNTNGFRETKQQYTWNSEDQLIKVITKDNQHIHYQYDGYGRRTLKHNSNTNVTTHIIWDGNTIAQEITLKPKRNKEQDEQTVDTTHWYFVPGSFTPLAQQTQSSEQSDQLKADALYTSYIVTDHMGTVKELFSPEGDLVWRNNNSLWGKPEGKLENPNNTPDVACSLGFQGQYYDDDTGLHYNFHRYYDAEMGAYISPDPIGLLGGLHPMAYVHNPNGWVDPFGLTKWTDFLKSNPGMTTTDASKIYTPIPKTVSDGVHANSLNTTKPTVGYVLFDLDTDKVVKFGETTDKNGRYSKKDLKSMNAYMKIVNHGSKLKMRLWETSAIKKYLERHGRRPKFNKCNH